MLWGLTPWLWKFLSGWPCGSLEQMLAACRKTRKTAINFQNGYPPTIQHSNRMEHPLVWCCTDFIGVSIIFGPNFIGFFKAVPYLDWWQTASSQDLRSESPLWVLHAMPWMWNTKRNARKDILIRWTVFNPPKQSKHTSKSKPIVGLKLRLQAKKSKYQASDSWSKWVDGLQILGFWKLALIPSSKSLSKVHGHLNRRKQKNIS